MFFVFNGENTSRKFKMNEGQCDEKQQVIFRLFPLSKIYLFVQTVRHHAFRSSFRSVVVHAESDSTLAF